jgi:hypothetical protein
MRDPDLVERAQRAAIALERAWDRFRTAHGLGAEPLAPVSSYVGYSLEEPWGEPRVVFGVAAEEAEKLAALLSGHDCGGRPSPGQPAVANGRLAGLTAAAEIARAVAGARLQVPSQSPAAPRERFMTARPHVAPGRPEDSRSAGGTAERTTGTNAADYADVLDLPPSAPRPVPAPLESTAPAAPLESPVRAAPLESPPPARPAPAPPEPTGFAELSGPPNSIGRPAPPALASPLAPPAPVIPEVQPAPMSQAAPSAAADSSAAAAVTALPAPSAAASPPATPVLPARTNPFPPSAAGTPPILPLWPAGATPPARATPAAAASLPSAAPTLPPAAPTLPPAASFPAAATLPPAEPFPAAASGRASLPGDERQPGPANAPADFDETGLTAFRPGFSSLSGDAPELGAFGDERSAADGQPAQRPRSHRHAMQRPARQKRGSIAAEADSQLPARQAAERRGGGQRHAGNAAVEGGLSAMAGDLAGWASGELPGQASRQTTPWTPTYRDPDDADPAGGDSRRDKVV